MKFELEAEWSKKNSAKTLHNIFILSYGVKILVVAEVNCPERGIIGIIAWKIHVWAVFIDFEFLVSRLINSSIKMQPKRIDGLIFMHVTSNTTFWAQISKNISNEPKK